MPLYGAGVHSSHGHRDNADPRLLRHKDQLQKRLRRIEGQVRYCIDVLTQISAVRAAPDKVALGLLDDHARHCVIAGHADGEPEELTDELMAATARLMRRG